MPAPWSGVQEGSLEQDGYVVLRQAVPPAAVSTALRRLHLAIRREGLTPEQVEQWQYGTFFPHLRWEPEIWGALPEVAAELLGWQQGDDWAEPQIVLRFPDEEQAWLVAPHVDELPAWAVGRRYRGIAGVALTDVGPQDGPVCVWPGSQIGRATQPVPVLLAAGDVLLMHPRLGHSGTLNCGGRVRIAVYFRLLTASG